MWKYQWATVALCGAFLVSACGEFAYKRGAQMADLEQDRSACHAAEMSNLGYQQCMAAKGWTLQNLDDEPLMATVGINKDNRDAAVAPSNSPGALDTPTSPATLPSVVSDKPPVVTSPAKAADPLDILKVGSWWKLGGNSADLQKSIDECVTVLGDAHRPEVGKQQMTRGLLKCLREKGWYGVANR